MNKKTDRNIWIEFAPMAPADQFMNLLFRVDLRTGIVERPSFHSADWVLVGLLPFNQLWPATWGDRKEIKIEFK